MPRKRHALLAAALIILTACSGRYAAAVVPEPKEELLGSWRAVYPDGGIDEIEIREDGSYTQSYSNSSEGIEFKTDWNDWQIEVLPDGAARLHLTAGRYYIGGKRIAELEGLGDPCPLELPECGTDTNARLFYDPFRKELVTMVGELVLNLVRDSSGKLLLHHMWTTSDRGFPLFDDGGEVFERNGQDME